MNIYKDVYKKIEELTKTDYNGQYSKDSDDEYVLVFSDEIEGMLENLLSLIDNLQEEIKDIEEDRDENYKPIPVSEQVGISDKDFI